MKALGKIKSIQNKRVSDPLMDFEEDTFCWAMPWSEKVRKQIQPSIWNGFSTPLH